MSGFELTPEEIRLFLEESFEQLQLMEDCLIALEDKPNSPERIQEIFRAAHTLKGGAATAGFNNVAELTHAMESLLDLVRQNQAEMTPEFADRLLKGVDVLRECLTAIDEEGAADGIDVSDAIRLIEQGIDGNNESEDEGGHWTVAVQISPDALMPSVRAYQALLVIEDHVPILRTEPPRSAIEQEAGDVRQLAVYVAAEDGSPRMFQQLRSLLLDIPDIVSVELVGSSPSIEENQSTDPEVPIAKASAAADSVPNASTSGDLGQTIRVNVQVLDALMNLVGELVIDRTRLAQLATAAMERQVLQQELAQLSGRLSRITTDLQESIMHARMMPVDMLFKRFPRMIRDISRQLNKPIEFEMTGQETELDRSVIEQIGDPLIHLLRNAADHGIETVEERRRSGKHDTGKITLSAYHQENHIYIVVADDGRGLDTELLKMRAIEKGIIQAEDASRMTSTESAELIFAPGFSTAGNVSSLSGRGVGMDVVKRNIERVNGTVTIETEKGAGTTITIKLPLTLAILQALMVEIAGYTFAIPLSNVTEAVHISGSNVNRVKGWEMITVRDQLTPLLDPGRIWGQPWQVKVPELSTFPVVVLRSGTSPIGLKVDRLLGEEEIVIKSMGPIIGDVLGISGASILGDGRVALIVDPATLGTAMWEVSQQMRNNEASEVS